MDLLEVPFENYQIDPAHRKGNAVVDIPPHGVNELVRLIHEGLGNTRDQIKDHYLKDIKTSIEELIKGLYCGSYGSVVEIWGHYWLYREATGELLWRLKIVWGTYTTRLLMADIKGTDKEIDTDGPDMKQKIPPHFGYEIYLNGQRVAGPGHVYFRKRQTRYTRDGNRMHEKPVSLAEGALQQTTYDQQGTRLDRAVRRWALGEDSATAAYGGGGQGYSNMIRDEPYGWTIYPCPSFGRERCSSSDPPYCQINSQGFSHVWLD